MIDVESKGDLTRITLDRSDKANALTQQMLRDLVAAFETTRTSKVVVLTGAGRVFCAGADLDAARAGLATDPAWEELSGAIAAHPGLTICALNGTLAGGAFGMALACDLRLSVPGARFFYPVMKLGFLPQPSDPARLVALVGPARAKLILMAGAKWTAAEALDFGLIDRIAADVLAEAEVLAADALTADPAHIAGIKALI